MNPISKKIKLLMPLDYSRIPVALNHFFTKSKTFLDKMFLRYNKMTERAGRRSSKPYLNQIRC